MVDYLGNPDNYEDDETEDEDLASASSHKNLFIIVATAIGLLALAIIAAVLFTWPGVERREPKPVVDTSTRIERQGYGKLPENIGDPAALVQQPSEDPIIYQSNTIIDACNLLPVETIREQKLLVAPGAEPDTMSRHYFDNENTAIEERWVKAKMLPEELNDCSYPLVNSKGQRGSLYVSVYQSNYAGAAALRDALDDYLVRTSGFEDVNVYDRTNTPIQDTRSFYFLEKEGTYVRFNVDLPPETPQNAHEALLKSVASNFSEATGTLLGPAMYSYRSPTFDGEYISACSISEASDIKTYFDKAASPSLQERIATATGVIKHDSKESNFVSNQCVRRTAGDRDQAGTLTFTTRSFENSQAAKMFMASLHRDDTVDIAELEAIGDATFFNPANGSTENTLVFKADRSIVSIAAFQYQAEGQAVPQDKTIEKLMTTAETTLPRITNPNTVGGERDQKDTGDNSGNSGEKQPFFTE